MDEMEETLTPETDDGLRLNGLVRHLTLFPLAVGGVGIACSLMLGLSKQDGMASFFHAYLTSFLFFLSISLGALFFVLLQHLTRAGWSVTVRRVAELTAGNLTLLALLALPIVIVTVMGNGALYPWANIETFRQEVLDTERMHAMEELLHKKHAFLNPTFFALRCAAYFAVWILLARYFLKRSTEQDSSGDPSLTTRMESISAPGMLLFALTITFAAFDLIMSLDPFWFSTIFGVYVFSGSVVGFFAFVTLATLFLQRRGRLTGKVTVEHYHDLGKMLFAFVFFWGYIAFSQYMLIWYANLPEETGWFRLRQTGGWTGLSIALLFGHFIIPFLGLISRHAKRRVAILSFWCVWMLVFHYLDLYYLVMPQLMLRQVGWDVTLAMDTTFQPLDLACLTGLGGIYVAALVHRARACHLMPVKDPRLDESLAFENY
jgi:hypothetical protein